MKPRIKSKLSLNGKPVYVSDEVKDFLIRGVFANGIIDDIYVAPEGDRHMYMNPFASEPVSDYYRYISNRVSLLGGNPSHFLISPVTEKSLSTHLPFLLTHPNDELNSNASLSRFFICSRGSVTDLEEIYCVSHSIEGYGEYEGQWRFKAIARLDGKPLDFIYETRDECDKDQVRMAQQLMDYRIALMEKSFNQG